MSKIICQTPHDQCTGGLESTSNGFTRTKNHKMHSSNEEAFKCYSRFLLMTGHTRLSSREFLQPEGGILVLTKPCRYGGVMRRGKEGTRYMPKSIRHTAKGGLVIG